MKLICDEHNQVYVWVDDNDDTIIISPHFDYEEDAIQWKDRNNQLKDKVNATKGY